MDLKKLNNSQKAAVEAVDKPILIFAGAGSGKTRVLTYKISHLIKKGVVKPEEILAVTFTNKAADVMKQRVNALIKNNVQVLNIGTFHSICAKLLRNEIKHLGFTKNEKDHNKAKRKFQEVRRRVNKQKKMESEGK